MTVAECVLDARAALGECPVWCGEEKVLYWEDISSRAIHRFDPASGENETWTFPDLVGSFALREGGGVLVALGADLCAVDLDTMATETLAGALCDRGRTRLNDGRCDPAGRFWVGSMDLERTQRIGALYRFDAERGPATMAEGFIISNGLAWSPDGRTMYHSDTRQDVIWAFDFDLAAGEIANRRVFATTDRARGRPDGAAIDAEGFYWSAAIGGGRLIRYAPDGRIDREIELPVSCPTMCAFGGAGLDTLYVTSARQFVAESALAGEPLAGGLFALDPGVKGLPEPRFKG